MSERITLHRVAHTTADRWHECYGSGCAEKIHRTAILLDAQDEETIADAEKAKWVPWKDILLRILRPEKP